METFIPYGSPNGQIAPSRICDLCHVRKVKCIGGRPCRGCIRAGVECTSRRVRQKPGPKGPRTWNRSANKSKLGYQGTPPESFRHPENANHGQATLLEAFESEALLAYTKFNPQTWLDQPHFRRRVPLSELMAWLDTYERKLFPVYPVVETAEMISRLQEPSDLEAYALATAISAVAVAHSKTESPSGKPANYSKTDDTFMAAESERCRQSLGYQDKECSLSILLSSFFLHIVSANTGRSQKATLLLREAVAFAHLLGYDKVDHYAKLKISDAQQHLRVYWVLFVTEKGHSTRFDLPTTLRIDPDLPAMEVGERPETLAPFINFCRLFHEFNNVTNPDMHDRTADAFMDMHRRLQRMPAANISGSELQRTNFLITQQWMQLVLWKASMSYISLDVSSQDDCLTFNYPDRIAREVVTYLNRFSRESVEAHGLGMEMKLCEVAISLAHVLTCVPDMLIPRDNWHMRPQDVLYQMMLFLSSFRGGTGASFEVLRQQVHAGGVFDPRPVRLLAGPEPGHGSPNYEAEEADSAGWL